MGVKLGWWRKMLQNFVSETFLKMSSWMTENEMGK
jgi:hypothetical protein